MKLQRALRHGIFFLAAVSVLSLFMAGTAYSKDKVKLTPEFLASEKWVLPWSEDDYDDNCPGKAEFTKKGTFTLLRKCSHAEMWINASGSYKIKGDQIILKVEKSEGEIIVEGNIFTGKLDSEGSLKFDDPLGYIENKKSTEPVKAGEPVKINSIDAVSMGSVSGHATSVIKIRIGPGTDKKEITWTGNCDTDSEEFKSVKKNTELVILARTKEKDKVGKWTNYWYYVKFYKESSCGGSVEGWVFGEFVKIK
jgi:hypothetical protein